MQLISLQEKLKQVFHKQTLHEWMCFESEDTVKHNWTDVAVHDRKIVNKMRHGETRLWIISEFGSQFLPMYCKLGEKKLQESRSYVFSSVEIHMLRFMKETNFGKLQAKALRASSKFYFITKGSSEYNYIVAPTDFRAVMDLVFCGSANQFL
jgi:hypothetical protein